MTTNQTSPSLPQTRHDKTPPHPAPPPAPPNETGHGRPTFNLTPSQDDINMSEEILTQEQPVPNSGHEDSMKPHNAEECNNTQVHDEAMGTTLNVTNDTGWIQVENVSKRKQSAITANAIDDTNYQVKQRIHTRGEEAIEEAQCLITPVKMELSTRNKRNVNLREEFLALFKKMQQVDPNFAVVTDNAV